MKHINIQDLTVGMTVCLVRPASFSMMYTPLATVTAVSKTQVKVSIKYPNGADEWTLMRKSGKRVGESSLWYTYHAITMEDYAARMAQKNAETAVRNQLRDIESAAHVRDIKKVIELAKQLEAMTKEPS